MAQNDEFMYHEMFAHTAAYAHESPERVLVIGGALGNMYDRIFRGGAVVDYLDVQLFDFAIFNFADICAVLGGFAFAIMMVVTESREEKRKKLEENKAAEDGNS